MWDNWFIAIRKQLKGSQHFWYNCFNIKQRILLTDAIPWSSTEWDKDERIHFLTGQILRTESFRIENKGIFEIAWIFEGYVKIERYVDTSWNDATIVYTKKEKLSLINVVKLNHEIPMFYPILGPDRENDR